VRLWAPRLQVHGVQGNGFRWATVLHAYGGQACPECGAVAIGANHRARHQTFHNRLDTFEEAVHQLAAAVRTLATEAGHEDWYEADEPAPLGGIVIGSGPLPPEMTGGAG
jgi:hypothetical protein